MKTLAWPATGLPGRLSLLVGPYGPGVNLKSGENEIGGEITGVISPPRVWRIRGSAPAGSRVTEERAWGRLSATLLGFVDHYNQTSSHSAGNSPPATCTTSWTAPTATNSKTTLTSGTRSGSEGRSALAGKVNSARYRRSC